MSLAHAHKVGEALMRLGNNFHLHIHSSGVEVTVPAGTHMDDANDLAAKVCALIDAGPTRGAFVEIPWSADLAVRVSPARVIRRPRYVTRLDQVRHSAMLRFPDKGVAFVSVYSFQPHEHGPFEQSSRDMVWRCERCHKRALKRELRAAGVTT